MYLSHWYLFTVSMVKACTFEGANDLCQCSRVGWEDLPHRKKCLPHSEMHWVSVVSGSELLDKRFRPTRVGVAHRCYSFPGWRVLLGYWQPLAHAAGRVLSISIVDHRVSWSRRR